MRIVGKACIAGMLFSGVLFVGCGGGGDDEAAKKPAAGSSSGSSSAPRVTREVFEGKKVYVATCQACHGADAKGLPNNGKDLTDSEFVRTSTDEELIQYVIEGREVPGGVNMPPRGGFTEAVLPDEDIKKVIAYMRNFPANRP